MNELKAPHPDSTATIGVASAGSPAIRLLAPGTELADRYEIRDVLGRGGYAVVYVAWDRALKREIALKVLRADRFTETSLTRFRREAAIAREVESPHLVRIFDIGQSGQTVYLTMERVAGESLRERLARGPLQIEEALRLAEQVLAGLSCLHRLSIVHRDVKPANILLTTAGAARLADFGLARRWDRDESRATEDSALVGTLEYVSPEQALGEPLDARSDLYSFGVVLFEMLTGRLPYSRATSLGTVLAHLSDRPVDPRLFRPELPRWLARLVLRLLEKKCGDRFVGAEEVLGVLHRRRLLPTRHRLLVWSGASLLALAALVLGTWTARPRAPAHRFAQVTAIKPAAGLEGVAADGVVLWERPDINTTSAVVRPGPGLEPRVACFLTRANSYLAQKQRVLTFLDSQTGAVVDRVVLPPPPRRFGTMSNDVFGPELLAHDLDGDGYDEVLVSFHHLYWPSFTILYEPRVHRTRVIYVAAGHHRPIAFADVDGDGRDEVVFGGISNLMGHYYAAAAVHLEPRVNRPGPSKVAYTPDPIVGGWDPSQPWYTLLPPGACSSADCVRVDRQRHALRFERGDDMPIVLGFDGFLLSTHSTLAAGERERARERAYSRLNEGIRLLNAGIPSDALRAIDAAVEAAQSAQDPVLVEWAQRCGLRAAIAAGRADAEREAEALYQRATVPVDVAFETASSYHLRGEIDAAVRWYHRAFAIDPTHGQGQQRNEVMVALLMADVERDRWQDARSDLERFATTIPGADWRDTFGRFLDWRHGGRPRPYEDVVDGIEDHRRYWALEMRLGVGDDPTTLLPVVLAARDRASEGRYLFSSLEGEILRRQGRADEALMAARSAYEQTAAAVHEDVLARGHLEIVATRLETMLRASGRVDEARRIHASWRALLAPVR